MSFPRVILRKGKTDAVKRFHPWIFSGAIQSVDPDVTEGACVDVYSHTGEYLATGHYNSSNIAIKILSFQPVVDLKSLLLEKFQNALALRQQIGLVNNPLTNCYRLANAEGDGLPGLIVDWYDGTVVLQAYSTGMYRELPAIAECLQEIYGSDLQTVYDKSGSLGARSKSSVENQYLLGNQATGEVLEYGHRFLVDWEEGQKTGLFLDQREHRFLLSKFATGKRVLNTFCYSGGFSVYALKAGAAEVHSVDSSARAIAATLHNVELNDVELNTSETPHETFTADVFDYLKHCDRPYDVIVLDPPAFAKNLAARHSAVMAYKRLNQMAIAQLQPGGILFTFSCSQVVSPDLFNGAVTAAAIETGRPMRILHHLTQPADHPTSVFHPEGLYLKGLVVQVG